MTDSRLLYEDEWGEIIDRPEAQIIELRWFDTTSAMSKDKFQEWLRTFAKHVAKARRPRVLIDGTGFQMSPALMDGEWRDANIIPIYNAAGVVRFAFHMPPGMPAIGATPTPEGPARFPTGYFARRSDAIGWLAGGSSAG